jgi:serine acetyltransferase
MEYAIEYAVDPETIKYGWLAGGVVGSGMTVATKRWGIDPARRNRFTVRLLLVLAAVRPTRLRLVNRGLRSARDALGFMLGSDFRCRRFGTQLFLPHPFGIVVHAGVVIGDRCTIFQHVTIGENTTRPGVPVLGDDVVVGAGAAILGSVVVGDGARIGANAVVLEDVPAGAVVAGSPAHPVEHRDEPVVSRRGGTD